MVDGRGSVAGGVPTQVLEVWVGDALGVPRLVWVNVTEGPGAAVDFIRPNAHLSFTVAPNPPRADFYEIRRPDGSIAGTAPIGATSFDDTAPRPLNGKYKIYANTATYTDVSPGSSGTLLWDVPPTTPGSTFNAGPGTMTLTWAQPGYGDPHQYNIYRAGVFQATVDGLLHTWTDPAPLRGTSTNYQVYAVLSGIQNTNALTITALTPALPPTGLAVSYPGPAGTRRLSYSAPSGGWTGWTIKYDSFLCGIGMTTVTINYPALVTDVAIPSCLGPNVSFYVNTESAGGPSTQAIIFGV